MGVSGSAKIGNAGVKVASSGTEAASDNGGGMGIVVGGASGAVVVIALLALLLYRRRQARGGSGTESATIDGDDVEATPAESGSLLNGEPSETI